MITELNTLKQTLLDTKLGHTLDQNELNMLINHCQLISFAPGEIILQQGKKTDVMYIIIQGTALVTAKILGEGGTYLSSLGRGNILGEMSVIEKNAAETSVIASSEVRCLMISGPYFEMLALFFPQTKYKITKIIALDVCYRLKEIHKKIIHFINSTEMASRSIFAEVLKTFTRPSSLNWSESKLNPDQLLNVGPFKKLGADVFHDLLNHATLLKAPNNCMLLKEDDFDESCFILLRGAVQTTIIAHNKSVKLSVMGPLTFFSTNTLIDSSMPSFFNYSTRERALLLKISSEKLARLQKDHVELWYRIFELLCKSLVRLERAAEKLDIRLKSELYNR